MSSRTVGAALLSVLFATLTGCDPGPRDAAPDPTVETSASAPAAEGSGVETPPPPAVDKPAIETAGLPVGGGGDASGERTQCVSLNWTNGGGDITIPNGLRATVTEILFDGGVAGGACKGIPSCQGYTFTPTNRLCSVEVTIESGRATLSLRGSVTCSLSPAECAPLLDRLNGAASSTAIEGPSPSPSTTTASPSPSASSSSSPDSTPSMTESEEPEPLNPSPDELPPTG